MTRPFLLELMLTHLIGVEMDHRNLAYLASAIDVNVSLSRWKWLVTLFRIKIIHIAGAENVVADAVSRLPCLDDKIYRTDQHLLCLRQALPVEELTTRIKASQAQQPAAWKSALLLDVKSGLYRDQANLVVIPEEAAKIRLEIIAQCHGTAVSGHDGRDRTVDTIKSCGYNWSTIRHDVNSFILACAIYQKMRLRHAVNYELHTTLVDMLWHTICTDTIGPLPSDRLSGCRYILVFIDAFSRYVELVATPAADSVSAADAFFKTIFLRHGLPKVIMSDNGPQFVNALIKEILSILEVKHKTSMPYHPQGNGTVERVNQEIMKHLLCLCAEIVKRDDWVQLLPFIQFKINNSVHSSLGVTPHDMIYGDPFESNWNLPNLNQLPTTSETI